MKKYFKGCASYDDSGDYAFKGRDNAIYELSYLIEENLFVTLYGKTGIGKTSLLNAGVFPRLANKKYIPIPLNRLRLKDIDQTIAYSEYIINQTIYALDEQGVKIESSDDENIRIDYDSIDCLWKFFSTHKFVDSVGENIYPILGFDQFEETLYSNPAKAKLLLAQLYSMIDDNHYSKIENNDTNFRIVISIREDDLFLLEDIIDEANLNELKFNRYRLTTLTEEEAREIISIPGDDWISTDGVNTVLELSKHGNRNQISSLILSVICSTLEKHIKDGQEVSLNTIERERKLEGSSILTEFYKDKIAQLNSRQKRFIETKMIDENGRRESIAKDKFEKIIPLKNGKQPHHDLFHEIGTSENQRVELIHDQIAKTIFDIKNTRIKERNKTLAIILSTIVMLFILVGSFYFSSMGNISKNELTKIIKPAVVSNDNLHFDNPVLEEIIPEKASFIFAKNCKRLKSIFIDAKNCPDTCYISVINCPSLINIDVKESGIKKIYLNIACCENLQPIDIPNTIEDLVLINDSSKNCNDNYAFLDSIRKGGDIYSIVKRVMPWDDKLDADIEKLRISSAHPALRVVNGNLFDIIKGFLLYKTSRGDEFKFPKELSNKNYISRKNSKYKYKNENITKSYYENITKSYYVKNNNVITRANYRNYKGVLDLSCDSGTHTIEDSAFKDCKNITSIILPPNLKRIGQFAFSGCSSLDSIVIPKQVRDIEDFAFSNCLNLKSVILQGEKLTSSTKTVFENCPNVTFHCGDSLPYEVSKNGSLIRRDHYWFWINENIIYADDLSNFSKLYYKYGILFHRDSWDNICIDYASKNADYKSFALNEQNVFYDEYDGLEVYSISKVDYSKGRIYMDYVKKLNLNNKTRLDIPFYYYGIKALLHRHALDTAFIDTIPISGAKYDFVEIPTNLTEIHLPFPQPYVTDGFNVRNIDIDIQPELKAQITLYVPYGCRENYLDMKEYQGYREIKEDGITQRIFDLLNYHLGNAIKWLMARDLSIIVSIIVLIIVLSLATLVFVDFYERVKNKYRKALSIIVSVLVAIGTVIFAILGWLSFYWYSFFITKNVICSNILGLIGAVLCLLYLGTSPFKRLVNILRRLKIPSLKRKNC